MIEEIEIDEESGYVFENDTDQVNNSYVDETSKTTYYLSYLKKHICDNKKLPKSYIFLGVIISGFIVAVNMSIFTVYTISKYIL